MERHAVFSCSVTRREGHVVVGVIGEIDRFAAGQFRNELLSLAKEHPASIEVDLTDVVLADRASLRALVETWNFARDHGIPLTVHSPSAMVTRTFDLAPSGRVLTLRV